MSKRETRKPAINVGEQEEAPVEAEPSQAQLEMAKATEIIEPLAKAGKSDDEMAIALIQNGGFPFKKAGRLLRKVLENLGIRMTAKDRLAQASAILLQTDFAPKDWAEVLKVCEYLAEELDATDEKQALVAVKKFATEQSIELPTKPKGSGGGGARTGFRSKFLVWVQANPSSTDAQFDAWVKEQGKKASQARFYKRILGIVRTVNAA